LQRAFFEMIGTILLHQWKHFVPSAIAGQLGGAVKPAGPSSPHAMAHFTALLRAIGGALDAPTASPTLLRANLACLEQLHSARNLYHRAEFNAPGSSLRLQVVAKRLTWLN
jgi:hypothetical protein